jgi:hypothetical protein
MFRFGDSARRRFVLRLRGDFRDSDYARFKSQFRKTDVVIGHDLSSAGGDFEEGMQIANLAHQKKLSVYVTEECNSVCAFVFLAATKRYLAQDSRIGVHSISNNPPSLLHADQDINGNCASGRGPLGVFHLHVDRIWFGLVRLALIRVRLEHTSA